MRTMKILPNCQFVKADLDHIDLVLTVRPKMEGMLLGYQGNRAMCLGSFSMTEGSFEFQIKEEE
jgi:hypothetical protein